MKKLLTYKHKTQPEYLYSSHPLFSFTLLKKMFKFNKQPSIIINIFPSMLLAKIERFICKILKIDFYHYPSFKLKNSTVQQDYTEIKKLKRIIDNYAINKKTIWIHCFNGCCRTGLIMSKIMKKNIYKELCNNAKQPIYLDDIKLLEKFKIVSNI